MAVYDSSLMRVLRSFGNTDTLHFTEIAEALQFETDLSGYYLRRLLRQGLVEKVDRGSYRITPLGKSALAHAHQLSGLTISPRISIMLVTSVQDRYVVTERTAQPFIGKIEWPTGPMAAGEPMATAAARTAQERLSLTAQPTLKGFFRRIDMLEDTIFDDKLFAVHQLTLDEAQAASIVPKNTVGKIMQSREPDLVQHQNRAKSLLNVLQFVRADASYTEQTYELDPSDLY